VGKETRSTGSPLEIISDVTEDSIIDVIESAALKTPFVIIDLEGTASMMVGYAMSRADLVIIPVQGSHLDATEAAKAIKLVRAVFKRTIPYTILFTRTSVAIRTRTFQSIEDQFAKNGHKTKNPTSGLTLLPSITSSSTSVRTLCDLRPSEPPSTRGRLSKAISSPLGTRVDIKPFELQQRLQTLFRNKGLAWTTVSKFRGTMLRVYKIGLLYELVTKNPMLPVATRSTTDYKAILVTPQQTLEIIQSLANPLHRILILTCAATALRASELLSLRWRDILGEEGKNAVTKPWSLGKDGPTKTRKSEGHVPLHPVLAFQLREWHGRTPYVGESDFVFPSLRAEGRVPLSPAVFVADHLRPAAIKAGVKIEAGQRFGLNNLRHSLSSWLVNKRRSNPRPCKASYAIHGFKRR
jgi:integrase